MNNLNNLTARETDDLNSTHHNGAEGVGVNSTTFVFDNPASHGDRGLFGPDSVAWRVWSHPAAFVGVIRSFLAEMMIGPEGSAALGDSKLYRTDSVGRLQRTMHYFLTVVFADTATVDKANLRLTRMHKQITGTVALTGRRYDGRDPVLMLATHLTTWHSAWLAYETLVGARPGEDEQYFAESARAGRRLGLDSVSPHEYRALFTAAGYDTSVLDTNWPAVPETRDQIRQFYAMTSTRWCLTPESKDIVNTLLHPYANTLRKKAQFLLYPVLADAAAVTLPRRMRVMASIPTTRTWETRTILAGRAAMRTITLPPVKHQYEQFISPAGYQCANVARGAIK